MFRFLFLVTLIFFTTSLLAQDFNDYFTDRTMRVDYYHSGTKGSEIFAIDQIYDAGVWAGSKTNLNTTLNLGDYQVRVFDDTSGTLIYSRGYSTIFNEWQTTTDAKKNWHTFHETQQLPMPKSKIKLAIYRRDKQMNFVEKWKTIIDPANDAIINKAVNKPAYQVTALMENGPAAEKVDIECRRRSPFRENRAYRVCSYVRN